MGSIFSLAILLPYCLVQGLVIPRQDFDVWNYQEPPSLSSNPDNLLLAGAPTDTSNFVTSYVDGSGKTQPLDINPARLDISFRSQLHLDPDPNLINESLLSQLGPKLPDPLLLNEPFADQLKTDPVLNLPEIKTTPSEGQENAIPFPSLDRSENLILPDDTNNIFGQVESIPASSYSSPPASSPGDDLWQ